MSILIINVGKTPAKGVCLGGELGRKQRQQRGCGENPSVQAQLAERPPSLIRTGPPRCTHRGNGSVGRGRGVRQHPEGRLPLARWNAIHPWGPQHGSMSSALFALEIPGDSPQSCSWGSNPVSQQDNSALMFC